MTWTNFLYATQIDTTQTVRSGSVVYPRWEITGPGFYLILTNTTTGDVLTLPVEIRRGETVTIDCAPSRRTVVGTVQGDLADLVAAGSEFWPLVVGDNALAVELGQTLPESMITLIRRPL